MEPQTSLADQTQSEDGLMRPAGKGFDAKQSRSVRRSEHKKKLMAWEPKVSNYTVDADINIEDKKNTKSSREAVTGNADGVLKSNFLPIRETRSSSRQRNQQNCSANVLVIHHDMGITEAKFSVNRGSRGNNSGNKSDVIMDVVDVVKDGAWKKNTLLSDRGTSKADAIGVEEYFKDKALKFSVFDFPSKTPESKIPTASFDSAKLLVNRRSRANYGRDKSKSYVIMDLEGKGAWTEKASSSNRGTNSGDAISIEEYFKDKALKLSSLEFSFVNPESKTPTASVASSYQSSQLIDDSDDIRVLPSKPVRAYSLRKRDPRKPFCDRSVTVVGESSSATVEENSEEGRVKKFACEICAEHKPQDESFTVKGCTHSYCSDCMKNYITSKLEDGVSHINCPVPRCDGFLEPEYCRHILPSEVFDRWGTMLCESVILASQKFYCPFKDCSALLVDDGGEIVTRSECPYCWRLFCAQCKCVWHEGIACEEFRMLDKDERAREDIMLRDLARNQRWQRCPTCKFYVEKSSGCMFLKCRCGVAFCYNCGSIHTDPRYHYCSKCQR